MLTLCREKTALICDSMPGRFSWMWISRCMPGWSVSETSGKFTAVNFPEVSLTDHPGMHRLIHIHENRPGMLSQINAVFSRHNVNICSEFLETSRRVGYVVID